MVTRTDRHSYAQELNSADWPCARSMATGVAGSGFKSRARLLGLRNAGPRSVMFEFRCPFTKCHFDLKRVRSLMALGAAASYFRSTPVLSSRVAC